VLAEVAAKRFLRLLQELSPGAKVVSDLWDGGAFRSQPPAPVSIATSSTYLRQRLGVSPAEMPDGWIDKCLHSLGFQVTRDGDALVALVPTWRATRDVRIPEDLVEELGRHYGYQRIQSQAPRVAARPPYTPPLRLLERKVRQTLVFGAGASEVVLYGFEHEPGRTRLGLHETATSGQHVAGAGPLPRLGIRNAISSEHGRLRRNLAPNLLLAVERNLLTGDGLQANKKGLQISLFEIGRVFVPVSPEAPAEVLARVDRGIPSVLAGSGAETYLGRMSPEMRAGVQEAARKATALPWQPMRLGLALAERLGGGAEGAKHAQPPSDVTQRLFRQVVGMVQAVAQAAGVGPLAIRRMQADEALQPAADALCDLGVSWLHPQRHGLVRTADGRVLGVVTTLHPAVRQRLEVPAEVVLAELNLSALLGLPQLAVRGTAPATQPVATLDVSLRARQGVRVAEALAVLQQAGAMAPALADVAFLYDHEESDGRSLTFRLTCRWPERSVTADDLAQVTAAVAGAVGAAGAGLSLG